MQAPRPPSSQRREWIDHVLGVLVLLVDHLRQLAAVLEGLLEHPHLDLVLKLAVAEGIGAQDARQGLDHGSSSVHTARFCALNTLTSGQEVGGCGDAPVLTVDEPKEHGRARRTEAQTRACDSPSRSCPSRSWRCARRCGAASSQQCATQCGGLRREATWRHGWGVGGTTEGFEDADFARRRRRPRIAKTCRGRSVRRGSVAPSGAGSCGTRAGVAC